MHALGCVSLIVSVCVCVVRDTQRWLVRASDLGVVWWIVKDECDEE